MLYCKAFYQRQFDALVCFINEEYYWDVVCEFGAAERADIDFKTVYINSRCQPETRFYTLLHEYGHVDILERDSSELRMAIPCYQSFHEDRYDRSRAGKIATLVEEIEAWKRGRLLAIDMGWHVNIEKYEKNMNAALWSYIEWAGDKT